jgi:hypothetical protein
MVSVDRKRNLKMLKKIEFEETSPQLYTKEDIEKLRKLLVEDIRELFTGKNKLSISNEECRYWIKVEKIINKRFGRKK